MNLLHSKSFTVTQFLARYFLSIDEGERILTVSEFLESIDVARGTIQNGLQILKDAKAIELSARGKLGTFLESKNTHMLLKFADISFIMGVMPLPYTKLYEGLSTGIIECLTQSLRMPLNMAYMRGAQKRIDLVCEGRYDFAVVSKFAADEYATLNPNSIIIVSRFGVHSYLTGHTIVLRDPQYDGIVDGMRVAVDYDSIDQTNLTRKASSGKKVALVPMSYSQFSTHLINGDVDAVIWNSDEVGRVLSDYRMVPISIESQDNTEAVIVIDRKRTEMVKLIEDMLDPRAVLKVQKDIQQGKRIPQY